MKRNRVKRSPGRTRKKFLAVSVFHTRGSSATRHWLRRTRTSSSFALGRDGGHHGFGRGSILPPHHRVRLRRCRPPARCRPARSRDAARPTAPRRLHADIRYPPTASAPDPLSRRSIVFLGACHLSRGTLQAAYVLPRGVLVPASRALRRLASFLNPHRRLTETRSLRLPPRLAAGASPS